MNLADWAESIFNVVEQDGATTHRVKLLTPTSGDVWHTWFAPFPIPNDWAALAESTLRGLENQCAGRVQVSFVAESRSGEVLSQLPWKVIGKLSSGNLESAQQAVAATFASVAQTVERVTELANRQLDAARRQFELNMEQQLQQMELLNAYRNRDMEAAGDQSPHPLIQLLETYGPQLGVLAELAITAVAANAKRPQPQQQQQSRPLPREPEEPQAPDSPQPKPKGSPRKSKPRRTIVSR